MTADFVRYSIDLLGRAATHIINEVHGVNRLVYDGTLKPPARGNEDLSPPPPCSVGVGDPAPRHRYG